MSISTEIYQSLGLSAEEYEKIISLLGREPTITELTMFSVEWSEHCGYLRSRNWLKLFPREGKYPILVGEDAGGVIVDDLAIVFKMESHNHPSQVEPKQGAATGVGGIIRDIFTCGARPIALLDSLRFGNLSEPYNRYLLSGVVDGIQFYGNCVGVPTVGGEIYFEDSYTGNCLVNVMCVGLAKKDSLVRAVAKGAGNLIMYVGASTGRDGIGGCSILASQEFKEGEEKRLTVQIGDPFMEKCLIEATLEALSTGNIVGIKDMGAAGLTCSTSEMASSGNSGVEIELDCVPRREKDMQPWEVMMSESQERMLVCVKSGKENEVAKIFHKWGLNAVVIGKVTDDGIVRIKDKGVVVAEIKANFLTQPPIYDMPYSEPDYFRELKKLDINTLAEPKDYNDILCKLLSSFNIASKEWVYQQYDHMVQTNTVILPGSDAAVLRIKGSKKAVALTTDCNGRYCYLNPYRGSQIAVAEARRNLVCSGAEPLAITDCLNFGNPDKPERFWQFKNCVEGIAIACRFFGIPVVSGNVSFYNENPQRAIYPTPAIGMVGIIEDYTQAVTQYFKKNSDIIVLLGDCKEELGGSEYLKDIHSLIRGEVPELDLEKELALHNTVLECIRKGLISSAHDCSEGGLIVAIAESCISNNEKLIGARIDNLDYSIRLDALFFGETQSRVIISCNKDNLSMIESIANKNKVNFRVIGEVGGKKLIVTKNNEKIINLSLEKISRCWRRKLI
ncbi:MAG: phosphoribosylformylglycinamidine synthase subunit PurL [Candidatus Omnitrophica bacterium]|nr:phosphoribosylformylglycinamidine synthase subunit PurL [Candidatus Omnitrophota bacterium]